jgi:hypothetical protein
VLRQFLRLEPVPFDDDAAPSERAAAQEHGSGGRTRKPLAFRNVEECDVTRVRKVVGQLNNGRVVCGYTNDFHPSKPGTWLLNR